MTITLVAIVRDEEATLPRCLTSARDLADQAVILDTGSTDNTIQTALDLGANVNQTEWIDFGTAWTQLLNIAKGTADWLLTLHADQAVEAHPDLRDWLATDPDPTVDAWMVEVHEANIRYRLPLLIRGDQDWRYVGATHEYLDLDGKRTRPLLGLTVTHHCDGTNRATKHERDLVLLAEGVANREPRAIFYTAQALECLGRTDEAITLYRQRAEMDGWEEEGWYAAYKAAFLAQDLDGLLAAHARRPWRHEPLQAAARIVARDNRDDILFIEAIT